MRAVTYVVVLAAVAAAAAAAFFLRPGSVSAEEALRALKAGRFSEAGRIAGQLDESDRRQIAAEAIGLLRGSGESAEVVRLAALVADSDQRRAGEELAAAGERLLQSGDVSGAFEALQASVPLAPGRVRTRQSLCFIAAMGGIAWRTVGDAEWLVSNGYGSVEVLCLLADPAAAFEQPEPFISIPAAGADPLLLLGRTRIARKRGPPDRLRELIDLMRPFADRSSDVRAEIAQVREESGESFSETLAQTAAETDCPDEWLMRGLAAKQAGDAGLAFDCYRRALDKCPDHSRATDGLAVSAASAGRTKIAKRAGERSARLRELTAYARRAFGERESSRWPGEAAKVCAKMGREVEALAWAEIALRGGNRDPELRTLVTGLIPASAAEGPFRRGVDYGPPSGAIDDSRLASALAATPAAVAEASLQDASDPVFVDAAISAKLIHSHRSRLAVDERGRRMHEGIACGVSVVDVDGDGRPDVYCPQSGRVPNDTVPDPDLNDTLFRLGGDGAYRDVTEQAGVRVADYSQGVAGGDFDGDGFQDLYVATVDRNRLLLNNGDGTYREAFAGPAAEWTSSVAIVDADGDGDADLVDVNYLGGDTVFTEVCETPEGVVRTCAPIVFPPMSDRLWLGDGAGGVADASESSGFADPPGNGLGLLVGRLDERPGVDVFVTNDMMANNLRSAAASEAGVRFDDDAVIRGVAFNGETDAEACMGIAADDVNADGVPDLFVTNFLDETNTLYLSDNGIYSDQTAETEVGDPSLGRVAFGTQFFDADNGGGLSLMIANGHVDRLPGDIPYRMRPNLLAFNGRTFVERNGGPYFEGEWLGRGVSRLDWNGDGLDDLLVSHIDRPLALLENRTPPAGRSVALRLVGTRSARDAFTSIVTAELEPTDGGEPRTASRQLFAGSGHQACNEQVVRVAVPDGYRLGSLSVEWPDGTAESFELPQRLPRALVCVEGSGVARGVPSLAAD